MQIIKMEKILSCLWDKFGSKDSTIEYLEHNIGDKKRTTELAIKKAVLKSVPLNATIAVTLDGL